MIVAVIVVVSGVFVVVLGLDDAVSVVAVDLESSLNPKWDLTHK